MRLRGGIGARAGWCLLLHGSAKDALARWRGPQAAFVRGCVLPCVLVVGGRPDGSSTCLLGPRQQLLSGRPL
eukprot:scaffold1181_cov387-Prasinococcus_capsulatus_cf.AAC.5